VGDFSPFKFSGRIGRLQLFGFSVIWGIAAFIVSIASGVDFEAGAEPNAGGLLLAFIFYLVAFVASLSYTIRRFHDFDKSGWWTLLYLVPLVNFIVGLILLFAPGTPGPNTYGTRSRPPQAPATS
jgi:uncharacterized membrane protein YhaH (DUF805 family)